MNHELDCNASWHLVTTTNIPSTRALDEKKLDVDPFKGKNVEGKEYVCVYCQGLVQRLYRHLKTLHPIIPAVQEF